MLSLHKQLESETVDFVVTHLLQTLIKCANRKTQMTIYNGTVKFLIQSIYTSYNISCGGTFHNF